METPTTHLSVPGPWKCNWLIRRPNSTWTIKCFIEHSVFQNRDLAKLIWTFANVHKFFFHRKCDDPAMCMSYYKNVMVYFNSAMVTIGLLLVCFVPIDVASIDWWLGHQKSSSISKKFEPHQCAVKNSTIGCRYNFGLSSVSTLTCQLYNLLSNVFKCQLKTLRKIRIALIISRFSK